MGRKREVGCPKVAAACWGEGDIGVRDEDLGDAVAGVGMREWVSPRFKDNCSRACLVKAPFALRSPAVKETALVRLVLFACGDLAIRKGVDGEEAAG